MTAQGYIVKRDLGVRSHSMKGLLLTVDVDTGWPHHACLYIDKCTEARYHLIGIKNGKGAIM
jgi:hypothetical protein